MSTRARPDSNRPQGALPRAVIVQHEEHEGAGLLGEALAGAGFELVHRFRTVKHEDADAAVLVVLGGPMGVYEADQHPFLGHELAVLSERLAQDLPCVGICLGAQLMARALGAEVFPGKNGFEVGVHPVRWTAAALDDKVIRGMRAKLPVAHWHQDTYATVPGATLLASTDRYTQQAFRVGKSYAFQFHIELTAAELGRWYDELAEELSARGKDLAALRAELPKLKGSEPECRALLERLAEYLRAHV